MQREVKKPYGFCRTIQLSYADAVPAVIQALQKEDFEVLSEIDVKTTLKDKLGADYAPYTVLGVCNPQLAHRALQIEPELGLLMLPCDVVVIDVGNGTSTIGIEDPIQSLAPAQSPQLQSIADQLSIQLFRVYLNIILDAAAQNQVVN